MRSTDSYSIGRSISRGFLVLFLFFVQQGYAQTLTISSAGQTGTSGTNWSASGSDPVVIRATGAANINRSVIEGFLATDDVRVEAMTAAAYTINVDTSLTSATANSLTLKAARVINWGSNVKYSKTGGTDASLSLETVNGANDQQGGITFASGASIESSSGALDIDIRTRTGSNNPRAPIDLKDGVFKTNGGSFTVGGATSYGSGTPALSLVGGEIDTDGGDVSLFGNFNVASATTTNYAIRLANAVIDAGLGSLTMTGTLSAAGGVATRAVLISNSTITSGATTVTGFINSNNYTYATELTGGTVTTSGAILLEGRDRSTSALIRAVGVSTPVTSGASISVLGSEIDLSADLNSSAGNGDILLQGSASIEAVGTDRILNSGSGNVTLITDDLVSKRVNPQPNVVVQSTGTFTLQPFGAAFSNYGPVMDLEGELVADNFIGTDQADAGGLTINNVSQLKGLVFGKEGNATGFTTFTSWVIDGPISFGGGDISINQVLQATSSTINLTATGTVTQSAAIYASELALNGSGEFILQNISNDVDTLAGGASGALLGALSYFNTDALTIGTVNPTGIESSAVVLIETGIGDIAVTEPVSSTLGSGNAVTLNAGKSQSIGDASGGDIVFSGNGTISIESDAVAQLFSGSPANSTGLSTESDVTLVFYDETSALPNLQAGKKYAIYRQPVPSTASALEDLTSIGITGINPEEFDAVIQALANSSRGDETASLPELQALIDEILLQLRALPVPIDAKWMLWFLMALLWSIVWIRRTSFNH